MGGRVGGRAAAGGDAHAEANTPLGCSAAHSSVWRTSASWSGTGEGQCREREPGSPWRHRFALRCRRKRLCCALASAGTGDFLHRPVVGATLGPPCVWKAGEAAGRAQETAAAGSAGAGPSVLVLRVQALLSAPQLITICKELRIKSKSEKSASSGSSRTVSSLTT